MDLRHRDRAQPRHPVDALSERRDRRRHLRRMRRALGAALVRRAPARLHVAAGRFGPPAAGAFVASHQKGCRPRDRSIRPGPSRPEGQDRHGRAQGSRPCQFIGTDEGMTNASARETATDAPAVSVVVPVRNEADNVAPLAEEIAAAVAGRWTFEVIFVNDGSTDGTEAALRRLAREKPWLRQVKHVTSCGQSAAVRTGVAAARAPIVATLDGDGQNDPAFIPALLHALEDGGAGIGLVAGQRVGRRDTGFKRFQSRVANKVRSAILRDGTRDTGCGLKAFRRDLFLRLPYFDGLHRFLPALVKREGFAIGYVDVVDRPRRHGVSNYGMWDRLWVGILDLFGVWWLIRRRKRVPQATEIR